LAFGSSSISSSSIWLHNYSIGSRIEGSVEIEGLVEVEALAEGFKSFVVDFIVDSVGFAGPLGDFEGFEGVTEILL
jgi:hypothetical protein